MREVVSSEYRFGGGTTFCIGDLLCSGCGKQPPPINPSILGDFLTARTTASKKAKGRRHQQTTAAQICEALGLPPEDVVSKSMGASGVDLILSNAARKAFPFGVECKDQEAIKFWESITQAEENAKKEKLRPLVVFKRNRSPSYAIIRFDDLLAILKALNG